MTFGLWIVASYLLGSIPTSYLVGRLGAGIDLRQHGSKNLGATNVYRVLGWRYAVPVGLVDVAKGTVPVAVFGPLAGTEPWMPMVLGLTAVLGHAFSVFVKFRGGKGVATAAGAVLALAPAALGVSAAVWLATLALSGYVSVASILGAAVFPVAVRLTDPTDRYALGVGIALALFIVLTHQSNIRRLAAGTENRFGRRGQEVS